MVGSSNMQAGIENTIVYGYLHYLCNNESECDRVRAVLFLKMGCMQTVVGFQ